MTEAPNLYLVRCKPHGIDREQEFIGGRISIGWPCEESLEGMNRDEISDTLADKYDMSGISVSMVDQFVKMKEGSIVLAPSLEKDDIHVLRTTSSYIHEIDKVEDGNPHCINGEYLCSVQRCDMPNSMGKSLRGARKTVSRLFRHNRTFHSFLEKGCQECAAEEHEDLENMAVDREAALTVLKELLASKDDNIRLQAAIALVNL